MKKTTNPLAVLAVGGLLFAGSAIAQTTTSTTTSGAGPGLVDPGHPRVNQVNRREGKQQQRIAKGISNGSLNPKEAAQKGVKPRSRSGNRPTWPSTTAI
jgi:hypothetical protein